MAGASCGGADAPSTSGRGRCLRQRGSCPHQGKSPFLSEVPQQRLQFADIKVVQVIVDSFVNLIEQTRLGVSWLSFPYAIIKNISRALENRALYQRLPDLTTRTARTCQTLHEQQPCGPSL